MKEDPPCQLSLWTTEELDSLSESQPSSPSRQRKLSSALMQLPSAMQKDLSPDCELSMKVSKKSKKNTRLSSWQMVMCSLGDSGRPVGESSVKAKYLDADVEHARQLREEGYSWTDISRMLEIPVRTVRGFVDGSRRSQSVSGWKRLKRWVNEN